MAGNAVLCEERAATRRRRWSRWIDLVGDTGGRDDVCAQGLDLRANGGTVGLRLDGAAEGGELRRELRRLLAEGGLQTLLRLGEKHAGLVVLDRQRHFAVDDALAVLLAHDAEQRQGATNGDRAVVRRRDGCDGGNCAENRPDHDAEALHLVSCSRVCHFRDFETHFQLM